MMHKVEHVHFVGMGGVAMSREQGPVTFSVTGCDRPRLAPAAAATGSWVVGSAR
jgi:UDP-N-acetylmuramate-alanine ligase